MLSPLQYDAAKMYNRKTLPETPQTVLPCMLIAEVMDLRPTTALMCSMTDPLKATRAH